MATTCGKDVEPELVPGGGITSGGIHGVLNVHVVDAKGVPVAGADVRVVGETERMELAGTTDAAGLLRLEDRRLRGQVTVSAAAPGAAPVTWFGVAGANVTVPLGMLAPAAPATAELQGEILGFSSLPAAAPGRYWKAVVGASWTPDPRDPANFLPQPVRLDGTSWAECVSPGQTTCDFRLVTRTGPLALFYGLYDVDDAGTPATTADDLALLAGWGVNAGLAPTDGELLQGLQLASPSMAVLTVDVMVGLAPASLVEVTLGGIVILPSGEGWLPFSFTDVSGSTGAIAVPLNVPDATGDLSGATHLLLGTASDGLPLGGRSFAFSEGLDLAPGTAAVSTEIYMPDFIDPPGDLDFFYDTIWFTFSSDAYIFSGEIRDAAGAPVWGAMQLDPSTGGALLYPAALVAPPSGCMTVEVVTTKLWWYEPLDFSVSELLEARRSVSTRGTTITW